MEIIRVAGCVIKHQNKFLILLKHSDHFEGGTWTLPCGKVEEGESDLEAVKREVLEETGLNISEKEFVFIEEYINENKERRVDFVAFKTKLEELPEINLNPKEHTDFKWVTRKECLEIPNLVFGLRKDLEDHKL